MVSAYVPEAGDIITLDFDPQLGRGLPNGQAKRRPALVITDRSYNQAAGLAVVCPLIVCPSNSLRATYPFALPTTMERVEGAALVDQLKSLDWNGRNAEFHSKAEAGLLAKVRIYVAVLLGIRQG
jgi:mRNA interferase MazF